MLYNYVYEEQQKLLREKLYRDLKTPNGLWSNDVATLEAVHDLIVEGLDSQQDLILETQKDLTELYEQQIESEQAEERN